MVGNPNQKPGRKYLEEYEKGAIKDVALLGDNEMVTVLAKFVPYQGVYVSFVNITRTPPSSLG